MPFPENSKKEPWGIERQGQGEEEVAVREVRTSDFLTATVWLPLATADAHT